MKQFTDTNSIFSENDVYNDCKISEPMFDN